MEIDIGLQSNCSEATVRIKTDGYDEKAISKLMEILEAACDGGYDGEEAEWDDDDKDDSLDFYETSTYRESVFGTDIIRVSGDGPYNRHGDLMALIEKHLPGAKTEWEE